MKFPSLFMLPLMAVTWPVHAASAASELNYQSAFEGYQAYTESEAKPWPEAIKRVDEIGGWRVYARETQDSKAMGGQPVDVQPHRSQPETGPVEIPKGKAHSHGGVQ